MTALSLAELILRGHQLIEKSLAPSDATLSSRASGDPARPIGTGRAAADREGANHHDPHSRHWTHFACHIDESGGIDISVRTLSDGSHAVLYDSVTETAFGPVIRGDETAAQAFLDWLAGSSKYVDPRDIREDKLAQLYRDYLELGADSDVRVYG